MPIKMKANGKPIEIRKTIIQGEEVICLDFRENGSTNQPKHLPTPDDISFTALVSLSKWQKIDYKDGDIVFIEGEPTVDLPTSIIKGDIGLIAFDVKRSKPKK